MLESRTSLPTSKDRSRVDSVALDVLISTMTPIELRGKRTPLTTIDRLCSFPRFLLPTIRHHLAFSSQRILNSGIP